MSAFERLLYNSDQLIDQMIKKLSQMECIIKDGLNIELYL